MSQKYDLDYNNLMICANGSAGMKYEHEMAVKTKALNPPNQYVPWVTLNGFHSEEIEVKAEKDLVALICETYQVCIIYYSCLTFPFLFLPVDNGSDYLSDI